MSAKEWYGRISAFFQTDKGKKSLILIGAVGVLLLVLPEWLPFSSEESETTVVSAQQYVQETEERLKTVVESIEGAGNCKVMVTLENGVEYVYATEEKLNSDRQENVDDASNKVIQRNDSEETIIVVDTKNGKEGLLITEIQPTVKGVVIVCEGGDQQAVQERIINAVTVALNISSKRVCVTKLS